MRTKVASIGFETGVESLATRYAFRDRPSVVGFLDENAFLIPLLEEAYTQLKERVDVSQAYLEIFEDPESDGDPQIVVSVLAKGDWAEADTQLGRFDDEWWLDNMDRARGKVCITLEFR